MTKSRIKDSRWICNSCRKIQSAAYWNKLSDADYLFRLAKARAKRRGKKFTITLQDVEAVDTDVCPIFHIPIKRYPITPGTNGSTIKPDTKSLDRIDSSKGYEPGNIRVISFRCNELLSNMTLEEFKLISAYYGNKI